LSAFEFVVLASLRAAQLTRGCTPRVEGTHKRVVIAQLEVSSGLVARAVANEVVVREPI
jgi:DNA-directed RNA polymerase subunit K/omega